MAFPKFSSMVKNMITKGPMEGMKENMREAAAYSAEMDRNYDRTDPEGLKKAMEPHTAMMNSGLGKMFIPDEMRQRMAEIVERSSVDGAAMHRMLAEHKAKEAAAAQAAAAAAPFAGDSTPSAPQNVHPAAADPFSRPAPLSEPARTAEVFDTPLKNEPRS